MAKGIAFAAERHVETRLNASTVPPLKAERQAHLSMQSGGMILQPERLALQRDLNFGKPRKRCPDQPHGPQGHPAARGLFALKRQKRNQG